MKICVNFPRVGAPLEICKEAPNRTKITDIGRKETSRRKCSKSLPLIRISLDWTSVDPYRYSRVSLLSACATWIEFLSGPKPDFPSKQRFHKLLWGQKLKSHRDEEVLSKYWQHMESMISHQKRLRPKTRTKMISYLLPNRHCTLTIDAQPMHAPCQCHMPSTSMPSSNRNFCSSWDHLSRRFWLLSRFHTQCLTIFEKM